ncbi:helix-turn-helix domain-containing protein [Spirillospora albida]|uniref:helix-turn-helix domain-containing protein n=1 Tax=Spirillospora albida TaxID=58123 RepID=UPI0004C23C25|nr:helix-turn-helix transcriptional regulator [Spirillospora albida]
MALEDGTYTRDPLLRNFGAVLRAHREASGLSRPRLAEALGCRPGWIEKLETAQKPPSEATANDLDVFFETGPAQIFWTMWREIKREGKHLATPPGFSRYAGLEAEADGIRKFDPQVVPGLLQTPAYARGTLTTAQSLDALDGYVAARMARQKHLTQNKNPRKWFVLDEAALRRAVGGPAVMKEQLELLQEIATTDPRTEIRVLPFTSVTYAGLDGSFTVLTLPGGGDIAYHEGPEISQVIEDLATVAEFRVRFDLVMGEALPKDESLALIRKIQEDYK